MPPYGTGFCWAQETSECVWLSFWEGCALSWSRHVGEGTE